MLQKIIYLFFRYFIGIVFIVSAVSKLLTIGAFEISVIEQGITSDRLTAGYLSRLLIGFELFLGVMFFFRAGLRRLTIPLTLLTLTGFTIYLTYFAIFRSEMEDCGCFGELVKMTPVESILKNLLLIAVTIFVYLKSETAEIRKTLAGILLAGCISALYLFYPVQPASAGLFSRYTYFKDAGVVDLNTGERLVVVFNVDCDHCQQTAFEMGRLYSEHPELPNLYCLIMGDPKEINAFFEKARVRFPYRRISEEEFFSLIGKEPPRIYRLKDGQIKDAWDKHFTMNISKTYLE